MALIKQNPSLLFKLILLLFVSSSVQLSIDKDEDVDLTTEAAEPSPNEIHPSAFTAPVKPEWVPDLENNIWKELGFPVEPEDSLDSDVESTTVSYMDPDFDISKVNLTYIENRVGGGRAACQCGRPVKRIINGEPAKINDIPWTVALIRKGSFGIFGGSARPFCGGTLINDRYVVTASHCVDSQTERSIAVVLNEQDFLLSSETTGTQIIGVSKIMKHPNYSRRNVDNDIALIKLERPLTLTATGSIIPVCLPANNDNDFTGLTATVSGWGTTREGGSTSSSLQKVSVPIISNSQCNSAQTRYSGKITDSMLCAGIINSGGKDACQGDSGGPLIIDNGTRKTLVGVVSWGYGCGQKRAPGVYTRVAKFPDWVLVNTKDAEWCSE